MISGVSKVVVPVDDQERAKQFWTTRIGFELHRDESYGEERWIEVSPPDPGPLLVLSPRPANESRREVPDELPHSPVFFNCADIEQTYRELIERGVEFPLPPSASTLAGGRCSPIRTAPGTRSGSGTERSDEIDILTRWSTATGEKPAVALPHSLSSRRERPSASPRHARCG
jgi:predicted enzyme related to lactoylglutathione lyase